MLTNVLKTLKSINYNIKYIYIYKINKKLLNIFITFIS